MSSNHVLLETINLTQNTASITFDNLPTSGYTDLKILMSARGNGTGFGTSPWENCSLTLNGTTNTSAKQLFATGAGTGSDSQVNGIWLSDENSTSNTYSSNEIYLHNYRSSLPKSVSVDNVTENNATDTARVLWTAAYSSVTTAVTSITIAAVSGSILAGSTFSLYGIAAVGTTPTVAPKATGGNIVANDGTYWYHAFLSSGNFVPQTPLTCDILQIAGGGAGGGQNAGGGGAGGLLAFASQSLSATNYACTIGAGGTSVYQGSTTNGNNSQFGSLTASVGGGAGGFFWGGGSGTAQAGGSGGGAAGIPGNNLNGGAASPSGQGNAGGSTNTGVNSYAGGGGGGASAVGGNVTSSEVGGAGGIGTTSALLNAMGVATNTGQLSSGNYYYAGGGGGGGASSGGSGGIGGGGAGRDAGGGLAGTANTGGGGGGSRGANAGGFGGSGIVIIRYAMA